MTKFHKSLRLRLTALAVIVLIGIIAVIHSAVYVTTKNFVVHEITLTAQGVAVTVAHYIMADIEAYKEFLAAVDQYRTDQGTLPGDALERPKPPERYKNSGYYQRMQNFFAEVMKHTHIRYIYTCRNLNEELLEYILDGTPIEYVGHSPPGDTEEHDRATRTVFSTGRPCQFGLTHYEAWSYLLGAYAPIFDESGEILGLVGVNVCGSHLRQYLNRKQLILSIIYLCIVGFGLLILTRFSSTILDPLLKDKLTGAYNKRYTEKLIRDEIATAIREHSDLALMVLDLDHFKNVNDTHGHNFGDKVLTSVSHAIRNALRYRDYFIRYGGEEFIALFPNVDETKAMEIAERIRHTVEDSEIYNEEKNIFVKMTISIGIATLARSSPSVPEFIHSADKALYVAKKTRNTVSLYVRETEKLLADSEEQKNYEALSITRRQGDAK